MVETKPNIVVDVDGVLLDFDLTWKRLVEKYFPNHELIDESSYNLAKRYGLTRDQTEFLWNELDWSRMIAIPYASSGLQMLKEYFNIVLITCIHHSVIGLRIENLVYHDMTFDLICSPGVGSTSFKNDLLERFQPFAFVDDMVKHCTSAKEVDVDNICLIERPYSYALGGSEDSIDWRASNMVEFARWAIDRLHS